MTDRHLSRLPYWPDVREYYARIRDLPWPAWLDSGFPESGSGRFDVIAADPYLTLRCRAGGVTVTRADGVSESVGLDPLEVLRDCLGSLEPPLADLPFCGGAIGFLGYDLGRDTHGLPAREGLPNWPDMAIGLYDWALLVDHVRQRTTFVAAGRDPRNTDSWQGALRRFLAVSQAPEAAPHVSGRLLDRGMPRADYDAGFARIKRYIRDGDCYQVNFAQRFHARLEDDAWSLYQRMREENPAPYGALLEYPFGEVLSSSPEQFLSLRRGSAQTRPIKGTRPRGQTAAEDLKLRAELLSSAKDRAENVMIVDLLRNDLGKVCEPGSIEVPGLFEIESFATVHHLVSTVTGRLTSDRDAVDLIAAGFPGGSITGAPKRRSMEIIDELEPVRREVYCGSVLRIGFDGDLDSSITIRTVLKQGSDLYYWAGGGIVADSDCDAEYQESLDKAAAFLKLVD